ncbi:MAG TPA: flagellar biosynthetic protein FliR, partial [Oligoflexia bacterium]|nr:flagellar biosynthetic protein FliR [Oligoflexia bacterium]
PCALALECAAQAGSLIDCARGAQFAEQVNPEYAQSVSVLEEFGLRLGGVALFFFGGMQCLLGRIALSIRRDAFPLVHVINEQAVTQAVGKEIASLCGELLSASVLLACPVFLPCLAIDLIFGVISRVQPRLSLFFDAITLKMLAGVFVLTLLASDIGQQAIFILRRTW